MAGHYKITYKQSGEELYFFSPGGFDFYVLPDGRTIPIRQDLAWCWGCRNIAPAEIIHTIEDVERRIKTWEDPESAKLDPMLGMYKHDDQKQWHINQELKGLRVYRELLLLRSAPAQCMKCGGTDHVAIPDHGEFLLPDGSDSVEQSWIGFAQVIGRTRYFDPDCHPMPEGYSPQEEDDEYGWESYPHHREWDWKEFLTIITIPIWILPGLLIIGGGQIYYWWRDFRKKLKDPSAT